MPSRPVVLVLLLAGLAALTCVNARPDSDAFKGDKLGFELEDFPRPEEFCKYKPKDKYCNVRNRSTRSHNAVELTWTG